MQIFQKYNILLGGLAFLLFAALKSAEVYQQSWAELLLVFAVLVLAPMAMALFRSVALMLECRNIGTSKSAHGGMVSFSKTAELIALPAGLLVAFAFAQNQGNFAAILTVPWLLVSVFIALDGLSIFLKNGLKSPLLPAAIGALFFPIGTSWMLLDRAGIYPFDYDAAITLLTAVHFHFAGFFFPLLLAVLFEKRPSRLVKTSIWLFLLGVPLTALGIQLGHFYQSFWLEAIAAGMVVLAVLLMAYEQGRYAAKSKQWLLLLSSLLFAFAMCLALAYALRAWTAWSWFSIPNLRFWHGSANCLAVGLGLWAWNRQN